MTDRNPLLLIVEDEAQMLTFLRPSLTAQGFKILEAGTAAEGLLAARTHSPELILLDLGLPDGDGVEFTRRFRRWSKAPIIVISVRRLDEEKAERRCHDYLTSFGITEFPFEYALRSDIPAARRDRVVFGPLRVDVNRREVLVREQPIHVTAIEYKLLVYMAQNAGRVLTHRQLHEHVWGPSHVNQPHHLVVRMAHLRQKIEENPRRPKLLVTESGVGYRLCVEPRSVPSGKRATIARRARRHHPNELTGRTAWRARVPSLALVALEFSHACLNPLAV
jgi:two-component system KDP operon response regulator KdpE